MVLSGRKKNVQEIELRFLQSCIGKDFHLTVKTWENLFIQSLSVQSKVDKINSWYSWLFMTYPSKKAISVHHFMLKEFCSYLNHVCNLTKNVCKNINAILASSIALVSFEDDIVCKKKNCFYLFAKFIYCVEPLKTLSCLHFFFIKSVYSDMLTIW